MTSYIALLRAVNLGPHNRVPMAGLRDLLAELGFAEPRTLLQSGNAVFRGARRVGGLERLLEAEIAKRFGMETDCFVRTAAEWELVVAGNPFTAEAERDPGHLLVMCCKRAPAAEDVRTLQACIAGPELVRAAGRELYIVYPAGVGTSRLTNALIERKLGTRGTGRNWNTVLKLRALACGAP